MISLTALLITIAIGGACLFIYKQTKNRGGKLPPGPLSLPVIGSMLAMGNQPYKKFLEWGDKYGKMCTVGIGPNQVVVLNDLKLIHEAFNDPRFSGRPFLEVMNIGASGKHGVVVSEGQEWQDQRRFSLRHLRDFGFGKKTMENLIMEDVEEFVTHLKSTQAQPISNIMRKFNLTVINSLWTIMSGKRHSHDDEEITNIFDHFTKGKEAFNVISFYLPWLAKKIPRLSKWGMLEETISLERDFIHRTIQEHQNNPPEDGIPRDFMDSYLNEIKLTRDASSSFYKERGIESMIVVCLDLFNAGTDTTSTTLTWTILYLAKFQEVQKKLQAELDNVVGRDRNISLADRPGLQYAEALILEILRYSSIVEFGAFHTTLENIPDFHGYNLPAGTWVTANHYYVHHSPKYWDKPEEFKPERFLAMSEDGKTQTVKKPDAFLPFSVGRRVCIGETLARDEIFLFMTNICQRFHIQLTEDCLNASLEHKPGLTAEPYPFSVTFEERL